MNIHANISQPIRIELPFGTDEGAVNTYLFVEPEPVLVDAGYPSPAAWDALQAGLAGYSLTPADLTRVIVTHPHVDHYGLAARLAAAGRTEVWIADVGVQWLQDFPGQMQQRIAYYSDEFLPALDLPPAFSASILHWLQQSVATWEPVPSERIVAFQTDQELTLGGRGWQVLHLPGHDSHLTAFYEPESRRLLSADALIIPTATPVVEAPPPGGLRQPALPQFLHSLERLAALDVETVHPGHGAPFGDHGAVIRSQQERIRMRAGECLHHVAAGVDTVSALFARLYGARANQVGMAGLWMVVGYLDLLCAEGRAIVEEHKRVWRYRATGVDQLPATGHKPVSGVTFSPPA